MAVNVSVTVQCDGCKGWLESILTAMGVKWYVCQEARCAWEFQTVDDAYETMVEADWEWRGVWVKVLCPDCARIET